MSRRGKIWIAIGIALFLAILIPVVHHCQLRFAVEKYIAELKAKGEPMDLAQVIPPPTPPGQNGVPFINRALTNLPWSGVVWTNPPKAMHMILPGKAAAGWRRSNIIELRGIGIPDDTNTWEDLGNQIAVAHRDLDSFQNLTNHPILDFSLNYDEGYDLRLSYLAPLKRSAQWLSASALYNLHEGNVSNACSDVCSILAIVNGETEERTLVSQLFRVAIASIGVNATWEILQTTNVSDEELKKLQQPWQSLGFINSFKNAMLFERFEILQEAERTRKSSEKFDKLWGYYFAPDAPVKLDLDQFGPIRRSLFLRKYDELRWRWFWSYQDELRGLRAYQVVIDATRTFENDNSFQAIKDSMDENLTKFYSGYDSWNNLRGIFSANAVGAALRRVVRAETARYIVVIAIALKRYQLKHGNYPPDLNSLTPEFLSAVPLDPVDGKPLRYKLNSDGIFLLYSVGENGVDDGGNPSLEKGVESSSYYWQNPHALDWVWPQPATKAEIQNYYAHPPK